jgi:hypothetical protein
MRDRTDKELYCLLYRDAQNYTPDATDAARQEFSRRKLNEQTMRDFLAVEENSSTKGDGQRGHPPGSALSAAPKETTAGRGCITFVCRILGILALVWIVAHVANTWLDSIGWVTHDHDTPVWIHGDWMVGEYRDCGMRTTTPFAGIVQSQEARAELPRLFCGKNWADEGVSEFEIAMPDPGAAVNAVIGKGGWVALDNNFHVLPVLYHGRIDRPDAVFVSWRCQRLSASLECKAVN